MPETVTTDPRAKACYILDRGWILKDHRQDGRHIYEKPGSFGVGYMELDDAYRLEKGNQDAIKN
jgi:hypothetical protein